MQHANLRCQSGGPEPPRGSGSSARSRSRSRGGDEPHEDFDEESEAESFSLIQVGARKKLSHQGLSSTVDSHVFDGWCVTQSEASPMGVMISLLLWTRQSTSFIGLIEKFQPIIIADVGDFHIFLNGSFLPDKKIGAWAFTVLLRSSTGDYFRRGLHRPEVARYKE